MIEYLQILCIVLVQASYDYLGWNVWLHEAIDDYHNYTWREWTFRIIKETLDFVVTGVVLIFWIKLRWETIVSFYLLKWAGLNDLTYMLFHSIRTGKPMEEVMDWLWWSPLPLIREHKYKAKMTLTELLYQIFIVLIVTILINLFL